LQVGMFFLRAIYWIWQNTYIFNALRPETEEQIKY